MMMMFARRMILVVQLGVAHADRRNQPDALEPLQRAVDRRNIKVGLLRHDRRVDLLGSHMLPMRLDHLEHLEALRRQAMALLAQQCGFFEMLHVQLLNSMGSSQQLYIVNSDR
jgi:hypothetical protein